MSKPIKATCPKCGKEYWHNKLGYYCDDCSGESLVRGIGFVFDALEYAWRYLAIMEVKE